MRPEYLEGLRKCCRSDAAFKQMQQILLTAEAERQQAELNTLRQSLNGEPLHCSVIAMEPGEYQESLRRLIVEQTADLVTANERLRQEIVDRRWAEQALQESEQRFRSLIENATDIIVILDEQGIFRYCSPSAERVLGYTLKDVVGCPATAFVHPADIAVIVSVLETAIRQPYVSQTPVEYRVRHRDGSWCLFEAVATSLLDEPAIRGVVVNCHDITERHQAEVALRSANRQIVNILERITDAFISLDREWQFTYLNQRAAQLFQRSREELVGQNLWTAFPDVIGSPFEQAYRRALEQQVAVTFEEFYPPLNTWFEVRVFPSTEGLSIFFLDVTERQQAQVELLEMSTALGNAVEGIARLDLQGKYIALNRAYAIALGYQPEEMIGLNWEETVYPPDMATMATARAHMLNDGKAAVEVRVRCKDGSVFYNEVVMVAAYDWNDRLVGNHCFTKDITERKQAEEALRQQAERERVMGAIAQRIRQSLDLAAILNTTTSEVRQFLKADRVVIFKIDGDRNGLVTAESVESNWASLLGYRLTEDRFKRRQEHYRQGKNLVVHDIQAMQTEPFQEYLIAAQVKALLIVPILHGEQLWGVLAVHQCATVRRWEAVDISLVEQLATQVAIAIQQSELYQQVQQFNAELENLVQERTAQLQTALQFEATLKRITDAVRDSLDEDQILQTAVQEMALGLNIRGCHAALHDFEHQSATIRYEYINSKTLPPLQGMVVQMVDFVEIFRHLQQGQYVQYCWIAPNPIRRSNQPCAMLVHAILDDQDVLGSLWLFKPCEETFSRQELRLVQQVANQCAIALRQARLYQAAQAQVAALEELNQLKDDFLSTVSHELRTPMSNMKMALHMLRMVSTPDRQERYLEILQSECSREIELINDLLDLQRLEASSYPVSLECIDLQALLQQIVEPFWTRARDRHQQFEVNLPPSLPPLTTDRTALERILAELLNNACKYTAPSGKLSLTVTYTQSEPACPTDAVVLAIKNAAEISAIDLPRIFEKFYRVPHADPWKQGGTGLGLALVQRLINQLAGTIQVDSNNGWTTFTISIPLMRGQ